VCGEKWAIKVVGERTGVAPCPRYEFAVTGAFWWVDVHGRRSVVTRTAYTRYTVLFRMPRRHREIQMENSVQET